MHVISAPTLEISLLGSLKLYHSIIGEIKENRRKVQALLIWLLLEDNQAHSREQLIALLWPEMNREDGLRNLRVALSRVKKHLADDDAFEANRIEVIFHRSTNHRIDVHQFEALIEETEKHSHESLASCTSCLNKLRTAIEFYRGRFLDGFSLGDNEAFEEWLFVWRERYHVMGLTQMGRLANAEITNGRLDEAEALAKRQIKIDQLQESAHRLLMRIAAERGDRTQALRQFKIWKEILHNELGIPPDEETLALKKRIEAGDITLKQTSLAQYQSRSPQKRNQLPETVTPFIGREEELALLAERLSQREYRLISIVGPGGIGKTRLAIQAARQARANFKDGTFFVSLVGLQNQADIPAAVADAIGYTLLSDHSSLTEQVTKFLEDKEILLVVDNLEHLIDGADTLLAWIERASQLMLLVTTREQINAQVEDLFRLNGLPWPKDENDLEAAGYEAVRLFGDRAHRLNKRFWLNEDTLPSVVRICRQVEGLPLAIELAATSIREFDVAQIAEMLSHEPELLATDLRDVPVRHRQFEAVFNYSWGLLSKQEQQVLAQFSLFVGGSTREAARSITGSSTLTLTRLRYKSLIRTDGNGRYSMHELLRQMAEKQLNSNAELAAEAQHKHAHYYLDLVQQKSPFLAKAEATQAAQGLWSEIDNIRTAWRLAVHLSLYDLVKVTIPTLSDMYAHFGLNHEGINQIDFALDNFQANANYNITALKKVGVLKKLSLMYQPNTIHFDESYAEEFLQLFNSFINLIEGLPNTESIEAEARCYWAHILTFNMDLKTSIAQSTIAMSLLDKVDDPKQKGDVFRQHAIGHYRAKQLEKAMEYFNTALTHYKSVNHLKGQASIYNRLAQAYAESANNWESLQNDLKTVELYKKLGDSNSLIKAYQGLFRSYASLGLFDHIRNEISDFKIVCRDQKNILGLITVETYLAELEFQDGNFEKARNLYQDIVYEYEKQGVTIFLTWALSNLSRILWRLKRYDEALPFITKGEALIANHKDLYERAEVEVVAALIKWNMGQKDKALRTIRYFFERLNPFHIMDPEKTLYEMYVILEEAGDPAALIVLKQAHAVLNHNVGKIPDPKIQHSFLNNVIYCKWLCVAFDRHQLPSIGESI